MPTAPAPASRPGTHPAAPARSAWPAVRPGLITLVIYLVAGGLAHALLNPLPYQALPYLLSGVALAATLIAGWPAVPGVALGTALVHAGLAWQGGYPALGVPLLLGAVAALQAGLGVWLVRGWVAQPLALNAPAEVLRFAGFGAVLSGTAGAAGAVLVLLAAGALAAHAAWAAWISWSIGGALGTMVGTPLTLALAGRPRADWQDRRRNLGLPLLAALVLLGLATTMLGRLDMQRLRADFERDADQLGLVAGARLALPLNALEALRAAAVAHCGMDAATLQQAAHWWLSQPMQIQAMGYSQRVPLADLPAFTAQAQAQGDAGFHVFDRDGGAARAADGEVVAVRYIEPTAGNAGALGVNDLSLPAVRTALLASRDSGQPTATAGFRLTQSGGDETGVVVYQALYQGPGQPANRAARRARFSGAVFVTLRLDQLLAGLAPPGRDDLRWCLVDPAP
ncbi:MAG: CHASE domain-containing protein, partial [Burkholderiales bacterium]|nr:CHASE domain-containing protein [Burkholderiales bacterium]